MTFEEPHQSVLTWANERGLLAYGSPCAQYLKTSEELGELAAALRQLANVKAQMPHDIGVIAAFLIVARYGVGIGQFVHVIEEVSINDDNNLLAPVAQHWHLDIELRR